MKKFLLFSCALGLAFSVSAQKTAGPWWVGGALGYESTSSDDLNFSSNTLTFGPGVGYWLNDQLAVGLGMSLVTTTDKDDAFDQTDTESLYHFQPFARYYKDLGSNFSIYGQVVVDIYSGGAKSEVAGTETSSTSINGFGFGIAPGIQYWFTPAWSVNATVGNLGYTTLTESDDNSDVEMSASNTEVVLDFSSINFGFNFHF